MDDVPINIVEDTVVPIIPTQKVSEEAAKEALVPANEEISQQFINSFVEKFGNEALYVIQTYGDNGVALFQHYGEDVVDFVKWAEKLNINPADVLDDPPLPGQTLEGWLLKIVDLNSPVNLHSTLKLSSSETEHLLSQSLHRVESHEFALGYFDPNKVDGYLELAEKRQVGFLEMDESLYNQVGFKDGDFWQINRAAIQYGMDQRKTFVLSTPLSTILSNPGKFTFAEIQMILHPANNYIHIHKDGYDMLIPAESLIP